MYVSLMKIFPFYFLGMLKVKEHGKMIDLATYCSCFRSQEGEHREKPTKWSSNTADGNSMVARPHTLYMRRYIMRFAVKQRDAEFLKFPSFMHQAA